MIKNIIDNLPNVEADTENLKIAKGKYQLVTSIKQAIKVFKKELKWQSSNKK
tara:strand:- start:8476 stop:8631 length:156 start_codon:yes stop_codon:yes gene_type:complete